MALTFYTPPGIGDFSAIYTKLCSIDREIIIRPAQDSPQRISPYLDILPKIKNGGYAGHNCNVPLALTLPPGTDITSLEDGDYFLSVNAWLEEGNRIENWIPGKTDFHYKMEMDLQHISLVYRLLDGLEDRIKIGVYCSAYGNSRHWGFWGVAQWCEFLGKVAVLFPSKKATFIFIGAEYDLALAEHIQPWMKEQGFDAKYTVGQFHIAGTIKLIESLDYLFSFPSGLGFLADVVRTPNMMWFPPQLKNMMGTFCDPLQFMSGQSCHSLFTTPDEAVSLFKTFGLHFATGEKSCLK